MKIVCLHRWFVVVAMIALVMTVASPALAECPCETQASGFAGGDGTPGDPYQVCLPEHLDNVRNHLSASFIQTADIDMTGFAFSPIGNESTRFNGSYNGDGHSIENLDISQSSTDNVGLFGVIGGDGSVANISVSGNVVGRDRVGCLAGKTVGNIAASSANCVVSGEDDVGVLTGIIQGSITLSSSEGEASAANSAGGLVGSIQTSGPSALVQNSYSTASASVSGFVAGGLSGDIGSSTVENCYASGLVTDPSGFGGGLIGFSQGGPIQVIASFWDVETTGQSSSAEGGAGLPTALMQMQSTFDPPWDFTNIWMIDEGTDYPRLQEPDLGCVIDCQCDDGNDCNGVETCDAGVCVNGTPVDCGGLDDECAIGICNPADGLCEQDVVTPLGSVCREAVSDCDAEETCDGVNPSCPADVCEDAGTSCDAGNGACDGECNCVSIDIPTVSEWGLVVLTLLLLAAGTVVFGRRGVGECRMSNGE